MEEKLTAIEKKLTLAVNTVATIEILIGTIIVFSITIARYFFNTSWEWAEELSRYLIICAALLASGPMIFKENHIIMDLLVNRIKSPKILYYHKIFTAFCIGICVFLLFIWGVDLTMSSKMRSYSLIFPMAAVYAMIPLTMAVMTIYSLIKIGVLLVTRPKKI